MVREEICRTCIYYNADLEREAWINRKKREIRSTCMYWFRETKPEGFCDRWKGHHDAPPVVAGIEEREDDT